MIAFVSPVQVLVDGEAGNFARTLEHDTLASPVIGVDVDYAQTVETGNNVFLHGSIALRRGNLLKGFDGSHQKEQRYEEQDQPPSMNVEKGRDFTCIFAHRACSQPERIDQGRRCNPDKKDVTRTQERIER